VILGTGTGVGKTFVAVALARALEARAVPVLALKPIETGLPPVSGAPLTSSDSATLERAAWRTLPPRPHPLYALPDAVSPHLAARREHTTIEIDRIADWVNSTIHTNTIQYNTLFTIIETAGGALSPLAPGSTNLDLAHRLQPARWLLVAPDALGVLHDLTSTLAAFRALGRAPDHLVLSASRPRDASSGTNADELRRLGIANPVAVLDPSDPDALAPLVDALLAEPA